MENVTERKRIGIIGAGQMGGYLARLLAPAHDVCAYDPKPSDGNPATDVVRFTTLAEAAARDIVFLFPPIPEFEACCRAIGPHVRSGSLIVEGCSVMSVPVAQMRASLPTDVELVGCHPLFGPQSGAAGLAGLKVVLSPIRTGRLTEVANLFLALGVTVVEMSPDEHDRAMARTQALEQFIGRVLMRLNIQEENIDVPGYRKLVELVRMLEHDSETLTVAVHRYNPHAKEVVRDFARAVDEVTALIERGQR